MNRLSQRGWGLFRIERADEATGVVRVRVEKSAFVLQQGRVGRRVCYMFAGWFPGSLEWVGRSLGHDWRLVAEEVRCAAQGYDTCAFETRPADGCRSTRMGGFT